MYPHGGNIEELSAYFKLKNRRIYDFSANINPLGAPGAIKKLIGKNPDCILNYPSEYSQGTKPLIAKYIGVRKENLIITNGSIEGIYLIARLLAKRDCLIITPAFSEYERAIKINGGRCRYLKTRECDCFKADFDKIYKLFPRIKAIFLCNPNNPTGAVIARSDLLLLAKKCEEKGILLIIDEAFINFLASPDDATLAKDCLKTDNILVIGSLTKFFALPGLRIGYITANEKLIRKISNFCFPWAVNYLAQIAASRAIGDSAYILKSRNFMLKEKDFLFHRLNELSGITAYHPSANFILCRIKNGNVNSEKLFSRLGEKGIFIRDCSNFRGLDKRYFRVAVKSRQDNLKLISALKNAFNNQ